MSLLSELDSLGSGLRKQDGKDGGSETLGSELFIILTAYLHMLKPFGQRPCWLSHITRKLNFCLCQNDEPDQLCSKCTTVQHLCFCYKDSATPLLHKSEISSL